jgi:hypothetical protein
MSTGCYKMLTQTSAAILEGNTYSKSMDCSHSIGDTSCLYCFKCLRLILPIQSSCSTLTDPFEEWTIRRGGFAGCSPLDAAMETGSDVSFSAAKKDVRMAEVLALPTLTLPEAPPCEGGAVATAATREPVNSA